MKWYAVERRYIMREFAYVEARTASEARTKVNDGEFYDSTDPYIERYFAAGPAIVRDGIPRSMWEASGYPDDVPIQSTPTRSFVKT